MVKLSSYSNGYNDNNLELTPWEFWTDEERSQVIRQAYKEHLLTSKEIKQYLKTSTSQMFAQFSLPALVGVMYFGFLRNSWLHKLYRKSPNTSTAVGIGLIGLSGIFWANASPFYVRKQNQQVRVLDNLYHKVGTTMRLLNDAVPRTRTSGEIDRYSMWIYFKRNFIDDEIGDDFMPPLLTEKPMYKYSNKKKYL